MNDATTHRIFFKGLKNAHSLATHIYEKGPQTLSNAISEVKKLNAVQQLTAMIIPPSTVNMMSNDGDHCFQCQEQDILQEIAPTLGVLNVMSIVTLQWIVHTAYLLQEPQQCTAKPNCTKVTTPGQAPDTTMKTGTEEVIPHQNHIFPDTTAQVVMTHIEAIQGHNIEIIATTPGVAHDAQVPHTWVIAINPATTHHINPTTDHPCTKVPHHTTPEFKVNHIHIHPTKPQDKICIGHTCTPADHEANHITRETPV